MIVESRRFADLEPAILYGILKLRFDVFVMEQHSFYNDLDGRDAEVDALHFWIARDGVVVATLRLLGEPDGSRVGRLATARSMRGQGMASRLLRAALEHARRPVHLNAQVGMEPWYQRFGFTVNGPEYDDGGVMHVPMVLR